MQVIIKVNRSQALKGLKTFAEDQLPFATARALTWTAQAGQKEVKKLLPGQFTLRNGYLRNSVRISPATKDNLTSIVGFATSATHRTDFMELHEESGTKKPVKKMIAVPVQARRNKRDLIMKGQRPAAVMRKKNVFIGKPNGRPLGIYFRHRDQDKIGVPYRAGNKLRKGYLKLLYRLVPKASIHERLHFEKNVDKVISRTFNKFLAKSLDEATKSRRV